MKMFIAFGFILGLVINIKSQSIAHDKYEPINPEKIHFRDDYSEITKPVNIKQRIKLETTVTEAAFVEDDTANDETISLHEGVLRQPNLNLAPPNLDAEADYGIYSDRIVENNGKPDDEVPPFTFNNTALSLTSFGLNLIEMSFSRKQCNQNVVISPYSVAVLLSILQQAAVGNSQEQITKALQLHPLVSAAAFKQLNEDILKRKSPSLLQVASNVFVSSTFDLNSNFKKTVVQNYGSDITPLSFTDSGLAAKMINDWVAEKTKDKIKELVTPDAVDENTQLILANAVFFKGIWETKFNVNSTIPRKFYLTNGQIKTTPFMRMRQHFKAGNDYKTQSSIIILPFQGEDYSLMVILPDEPSSVSSVLGSLSEARLLEYNNFLSREVDLELPRFTIKDDTNLKPILRMMGITDIFGQNSNLSGLGMYQSLSPQVSHAFHTALLSIDEEGGTAAAASAFAAVALINDGSTTFRVNRPFITVLWDNKASIPLFIAKVEDPTSQ